VDGLSEAEGLEPFAVLIRQDESQEYNCPDGSVTPRKVLRQQGGMTLGDWRWKGRSTRWGLPDGWWKEARCGAGANRTNR